MVLYKIDKDSSLVLDLWYAISYQKHDLKMKGRRIEIFVLSIRYIRLNENNVRYTLYIFIL